MSVSSKNPLRLAGATVNSGDVNTGEQKVTTGGGQSMSIYSGNAVLSGVLSAAYANAGVAVGTGYDVLLVSGAGRIKDVMLHQQALSGLAITFYDAGAVSSGGPFPLSGHKVVAVVPGSTNVANPINSGTAFVAVTPLTPFWGFDKPFQSGLCVALKSGQPGFTVDFIPETNPATGYGG